MSTNASNSTPGDPVSADENLTILRSMWEPHPGQRAVLNAPHRFRIVACGRRWGKSEMAAHAAVEYALENPGSTVWWVAPTYDQSNDFGFDNVKPLLSPDVLEGEPKLTKPRRIDIDNGSTISFRSADREDSLRGGGIDLLVPDEAGSIPGRAWTEELRPSLSDTLGDVLAVGTPKGRNWFYKWFQRGKSADHSDVASWQGPTEQNPHIPPGEVEDARGDMPERVFKQEYLAQFVEASGSVFGDVREHVADYGLPVPTAEVTAPVGIGVDFARFEDIPSPSPSTRPVEWWPSDGSVRSHGPESSRS